MNKLLEKYTAQIESKSLKIGIEKGMELGKCNRQVVFHNFWHIIFHTFWHLSFHNLRRIFPVLTCSWAAFKAARLFYTILSNLNI